MEGAKCHKTIVVLKNKSSELFNTGVVANFGTAFDGTAHCCTFLLADHTAGDLASVRANHFTLDVFNEEALYAFVLVSILTNT